MPIIKHGFLKPCFFNGGILVNKARCCRAYFRAKPGRNQQINIYRRCFPIASGKKELEINGAIRDREVRVINADGSQMGVMPTREAMKLAEDQDMDLVKIAPQANPPVVKVLDYGKYRFELQKKEKEARKNQKIVETKEIRLSLKIDTNDLNTKLKNARKFLGNGDKLKVSIRFRGREMAHPQIGLEVHRRFAASLADMAVVEKPAKLEGRSMLMFLAPIQAKEQPGKGGKKTAPKPAGEEKPTPAPEKPAQGT